MSRLLKLAVRPDCCRCDLWREHHRQCGILQVLELPPAAHTEGRTSNPRPCFEYITAPPAEGVERPPGWRYDRHRAAIASIGHDDAAARSYLQGDEATCGAFQPIRAIPTTPPAPQPEPDFSELLASPFSEGELA